jgi:hypothetical protein
MTMRAIFLQLPATDPARLKIETAKRPNILENQTKSKIDQNKFTAKHYVQQI